MKNVKNILALAAGLAMTLQLSAKNWVTYEGKAGPGKGKQIVFLCGDEEYRSEEALPMMAKILAVRHGFKCTVLFAMDSTNGTIAPNNKASIPGIEALDGADLCFMLLRFREWPDADMKHFVDYLHSGRPIIALRTSTHAFNYANNSTSIYKNYSWQNKEWPGGFGRQVLGETWVNHHGSHGKEATRGVIEPAAKDHPILRGVTDIFGPTDVYTANPPADVTVLLRGQVLTGMKPTDGPVDGPKNNPMQPIAWTRQYKNEAGKVNKILTTTMGAANDLPCEDLRRLLVNGVYWCVGLENKLPAKADVTLVGDYQPSNFGFNGYKKGVKPGDLELK